MITKRRIKKHYSNQIARVFAVLVGMIILAVFILTIYITGKNELNRSINTQTEFNIKVMQFVTGYFDEMEEIARQTTMNTDLFHLFESLANEEGDDSFDNDIIGHINATTALRMLTISFDSATRISIYNRNDDFISSDLSLEASSAKDKLKHEMVDVGTLLSRIQESARYLISSPHKDWWSETNDRTYITLFAPIGNNFSTSAYGIVEVDKDVEQLQAMFSMENIKGLETYLFYYDELIAASENESLTKEQTASLYNEVRQMIFDGQQNSYIQDQRCVTAIQVKNRNMAVVMVRSKKAIQSEFRNVRIMIAAALFLAYALIVSLIFYLSRRLTDPLIELSESAEQISIHDMVLKENGNAPEEVASLTRSFNRMLSRLEESVRYEMAAQLDAIQNQMDSHFLWNMLSVINALAQEDDSEAVCRVSEKLADMLRYINDYRQETVTLSHEMKCAIDFMELMKEYYEKGFSYYVEMDPVVSETIVPKMVIQPLVDNCFKHGFLYTTPPWHIDIIAKGSHEGLLLRVINNGKTFEDASIKEIEERIEKYKTQPLRSYKSMQFGGLGLVSTIVRMNLLYPNRIQYQIIKMNDGRTCVEVLLQNEDSGVNC